MAQIKSKNADRPGRLRIIGGQWRGRKLPVVANGLIRPSGDRVRETLFNWLAPFIEGTSCLDLFAGTGILGFEAMSRGATRVTLVELDKSAADQIAANIASIGHDGLSVVHENALKWIEKTPNSKFDIVFLDPPFGDDYLPNAITRLAENWLSETASIYVENASPATEIKLPADFRWVKAKKVGKVHIGLARKLA